MNVIMLPDSNDADSINNSKEFCFFVFGSYDPNDKKVQPAGYCDPGYIADSQLLNYTVRFQNTGTAPAVNVFILDTLHENLNPDNSLVVWACHIARPDLSPVRNCLTPKRLTKPRTA